MTYDPPKRPTAGEPELTLEPVDHPVDLLTADWLEKVVKTPDSDVRAHRVALTYSKLSGFLDDLINGESSVSSRLGNRETGMPCNANWFHFATWGTVTIAANIANERPPQRIDMLPFTALRRRLTPAVIQLRASSGQRVSRALAWGQRLIFVSVCFTLEYLDRWLGENPDGDAQDFRLLDDEGEPTDEGRMIIDLGTWDGRKWIQAARHLRVIADAFRFYIHARRADCPAQRARCVLGGNVLLTAVEQDLVDPAIEVVVNHIPRTVASAVDWRLARWVERRTGVPSQVTSLQLPFRWSGAREILDAAWSRLMTDQVFVMALPTETLRLGRDIPPLRLGQPYFPIELQELRPQASDRPDDDRDDPLTRALQDVADLIESLDRTTGNGRGSAARDWRRWDERMNWALTLQRSRQQDETLYWSPYSQADQRRIVSGELPQRVGDPSALQVQAPIGNAPFVEGAEGSEL